MDNEDTAEHHVLVAAEEEQQHFYQARIDVLVQRWMKTHSQPPY
jgi:hypothetical protein